MFKFNFDVDDLEDSELADSFSTGVRPSCESAHDASASAPPQYQDDPVEDASNEVDINELLSTLPPVISFSPIAIPLSSKREVVLAKRDLFDARFQLISTDEDTQSGTREDERSEVAFVDAPSDLVPGVYEGGLKTWECSFDLVDCLDSIYGPNVFNGLRRKRILELGCGTALPSVYLIHSIFAATFDTEPGGGVHIHLQDYNALVLRLVTLPNIILAWYMSPASSAYRSSMLNTVDTDKPADSDLEPAPLPPADPTQPGELPLTPALSAAFLESLKAYRISLKFFSGGWKTFDVDAAGGPYNLLLTSETIYSTSSLPSLVDLLRRAADAARGELEPMESAVGRLSLAEKSNLRALTDDPHLCLVAAKLVYFGVGGGVNEFVETVENTVGEVRCTRAPGLGAQTRGSVRTVWEGSVGVRRRVMQVLWETVKA